MGEPRFGRVEAPDDKHIQKYALTQPTMPSVPSSMVIGINFYGGFFASSLEHKDGALWFPYMGRWGRVFGGHAMTLKARSHRDHPAWWRFYDQDRNDCVGYSCARMSTLHNRELYRGDLIYDVAAANDEFPGTEDGTSVRAGLEVLRTGGPFNLKGARDPADGISVYRWATSVEDVAYCLDPASEGKRILRSGYVVVLNSWGENYPHYVRIDLEALNRLLFVENGDAAVVTDK